MKASLPFKYIIAVKSGKQYVVFDYKDSNGKRQRKWVGTGLAEKCSKRALVEKVNELVSEFFSTYLNEISAQEPTEDEKEPEIKPEKKSGKKSQPLPETVEKPVSELTNKDYGFTEFMRVWLETIRPTIAETSYQGYLWKVNTIVDYFDENYPDIKLNAVTGMILQKFYNEMFTAGRSANTVKHYHANIHKALQYALKMDLVQVNESDKTERPKLIKYEATFYNPKELELLFAAFRGDRMELVVLIAAYYGLRRSEIIGLKWSSIDFDKKTLTVHEQAYNTYENGKMVVKFHNQLKTKSSYRTLPLIPKIEELLLTKRKNDKYLAQVLKKGYNHEYDEYICTDNFGELITPNYVTDHFRQMIKKHKLKKLRFHDLRHSCASLLVANGVPMKAIQEWLGHSTFHVTADYYSHLDFNSKIESANTIANILGGSEESEKQEEKPTMKRKKRKSRVTEDQ